MDMKKSFLALILIIIFLFAVLSGCSSNTWTNETTTVTTTTTTTEQTTLSEEEILKNNIKAKNEYISKTLKEEYGYTDVQFVCYINFQDFINGLENNPSDFFFIGTDYYEISQLYDNTRFYKNEDALEVLNNASWGNADYVISYIGTKKDAYGKERAGGVDVPIIEKSDGYYNWWLFDSSDDVGLETMILGVAQERCTAYYL